MADDDKKGSQPLDPFAEVDDDEWFSAVDAWDDNLELPVETPAADKITAREHSKAAPLPVAPPSGEAAGEGLELDPLVSLIDGDMEVDPAASGHALGALLGSSPVVEEQVVEDEQVEEPPPPPADAGDDIGMDLDPDAVSLAVGAEVEVAPVGFDAPPAEVVPEPPIEVVPEPHAEVVAEAPEAIAAEPPRAPDAEIETLLDEFTALDAPAAAAAVDAPLAEPPSAAEPPLPAIAPPPPASEPPLAEPPPPAVEPPPPAIDAVEPPAIEPPAVEPPPAIDAVEPPVPAHDLGLDDPTPVAPIAPEVAAAMNEPMPPLEGENEATSAALGHISLGVPAAPPAPSDAKGPGELLDILDAIRPADIPEPSVSEAGDMLGATPEAVQPLAPVGPLAAVDPDALGEELEPALPALPELGPPDPSALSQAAPSAPSDVPAVWDDAAGALRGEVARVGSAQLAADLELFAAEDLDAAGQHEAAAERLEECLQHRPSYLAAQVALYGAAVRAGQADRVIELGRGIAAQLRPEARPALLAGCADVAWVLAGDDTGARELVDECGGAGGGARVALVAHDLTLQDGAADEERRRAALEALAAASGDAELRAVVALQRGRQHERAGEIAAAKEAYRAALAERAELAPAWEGLARCATREDDRALLAEALQASAPALAELEPTRRRRLAQLARWRDIADVDADDQIAQAATEGSDEPLVLDAWARQQARAGSAHEAVAAYRQLASALSAPAERCTALCEAALLCEGVGDAEQAAELFKEALEALPGDGPAAAGLTRLQADDPDPQRRLDAQRAAASATSGAAAAVKHLAAARLLEVELEDSDAAVAQLAAALGHDPTSPSALSQLERACRARGEVERLARAFDDAARTLGGGDITPPADDADGGAPAPLRDLPPGPAVEMALRAARLYEGPLGRPALAAERYRAALAADSERADARWGLLRTLEASGDTGAYVEQLAHEAGQREGSLAANLWIEHALDSPADEAEGSLRAALGHVEDEPAAREALIGLAAAAGDWGQVAELWSAREQQLAAVVDETDSAAKRAGAQLERAALLFRVGALQGGEEPRDLSAAADTLGRARALGVEVPGLDEAVGAVHRAANDLEAMATALTERSGRAGDAASRLALLLAAADLSRRAGVDWQQAQAQLKTALTLSPNHPLARRGLEELLRSRGERDEIGALLLEGADGDVARLERALEHQLLDDEHERADSTLAKLLAVAPTSVNALGVRLRRAFETNDSEATLAALRAWAEGADAAADASAGWLELGRALDAASAPPSSAAMIVDDAGGDADGAADDGAGEATRQRATEAFERAALDDHSHTLPLLSVLDGVGDEDPRAAAATQRLADLFEDGSTRSALLARAAHLSGDDIAGLCAALGADPTYLGAVHRLRLAALVAEDWDSAIIATEAELAASAVPERVVWAAILAGELAQDKLGDAERAAGHYRHALQIDPAHERAFDALRRLLEEGQRHQELAEMLASRLEAESSSSKRIELLRNLAQIAADHLDDHEQAKTHLRALLELDAEDNRALARLASLYELDGQWPQAADALLRQCRLEVNPQLLAQLFRRLGRIYQEQLPDNKRAIAAYRRVVSLAPRDLDAHKHLSDLYVAELEFENALAVTKAVYELEPDADERIDYLLRIAKIFEDGLKDSHQASLAFRRANELAPADLKSIGALCGFFARQGDQRSMMVHLDRSVAAMRARLIDDPFESFAYHALFRIFGWRKSADGGLVAAQILELLGEADAEERAVIEKHARHAARPGKELGADGHDDRMFDRAIPGGFRQIFELLGDSFSKIRKGDVRSHGVGRGDRLTDSSHPVRRIADGLAADFGVRGYTLYISGSEPTALLVENTDPPSIIIGKGLVDGATEDEVRFLLGRCLWIARKSMMLPTRLRPEDLALLVAGVIRQYSEFELPGATDKQLADITKQVHKVIPRRLRQELMPFALECSGHTVDLRGLGAAVIHSANRAGLLACGSIRPALLALRKAGGHVGDVGADIATALGDNPEIETLIRFAVSDDHFELRRGMGISAR